MDLFEVCVQKEFTVEDCSHNCNEFGTKLQRHDSELEIGENLVTTAIRIEQGKILLNLEVIC